MRTGDLLYSALQFIISVIVVLMGIFFLGIHCAPQLRYSVIHFLNTSTLFSLLGYLFLGGGIFLLAGFYRMHRGIYFQIGMKAQAASVNPKLIQKYIENYWGARLPDQRHIIQVIVAADQKIEIYMELEAPFSDEQKPLFENAEEDLGYLLNKQFGYSKDFLFSVLVK